MANPPAIKEKLTKSQLYASLAESTGLSKAEITSVFDALEGLIAGSVQKNGFGEFTLPGLLKISTKNIPAKPARKGVPNPFKPGELMDTKAKPATRQVKVRPLKKLKDYAIG